MYINYIYKSAKISKKALHLTWEQIKCSRRIVRILDVLGAFVPPFIRTIIAQIERECNRIVLKNLLLLI